MYSAAKVSLVFLLAPVLLLGGCTDVPADNPLDPSAAVTSAPRKVTYFVAADVVPWDYAPAGRNEVAGRDFTEEEEVFVKQGEHRIGSRYYKALYREYTDGSFGTLKPRTAEWAHLGALGPALRAAVMPQACRPDTAPRQSPRSRPVQRAPQPIPATASREYARAVPRRRSAAR